MIAGFEAGQLDRLQEIRARAFAPVFRSLREVVGPTLAADIFANAESEQEQLLADLCAGSSQARVLVASAGGQPVGFAAVTFDQQTKVGEIGLNAVDPDWAGRGVGTRLYEFARGEMRAAGMRVASVATGGDPGHAPARRAYAKAGFAIRLDTQWLYRAL